jgi:HD-like signal output (HDOD) protein
MIDWLWKKKTPSIQDIAEPLPTETAPTPIEDPLLKGFSEAWTTLYPERSIDPIAADTPLTRPPLTDTERTFVEQIQPLLMEQFVHNLPAPASFPAVAVQVVNLLESQDPDLHELLKCIEQDAAISAELLKVANSAYYHRGTDIQDLRSAVMRLGMRQSGEIAVGIASRSLFDIALRAELEIFNARQLALYHSSMAIAFGASEFAFIEQVGRPNRAFLCGMFHDIGHSLALRCLASMMLADKMPKHLAPAVLDELTERVHLEVGYTVHAIWGLPPYLSAICAQHHDPEVPVKEETEDLHTLRLTSGFYRLVVNPRSLEHLAETRQSLEAMGLDRAAASQLFALMAKQRAQVMTLFPG